MIFKRYETFALVIVIFTLVLILRFVFHLTHPPLFEARRSANFTHTFFEKPERGEFQQFFYVESLLVTLPLFPEFEYGDKVKIEGMVESYLTKDGEERVILKNPRLDVIENVELSLLVTFRSHILKSFQAFLPPREAGLISGIVLGVEDGINEKFKEELKRTGMLHVVVASGSNIVFIAGLVFVLGIKFLQRNQAILVTVVSIFLYALLTGFEPPIVRASIMASFAFIGLILGRQRIALISLFFSAWVMVMIVPNLISDIGFQLSFSATFGIIMFQKVIFLVTKFLPSAIKEDFSTTFSAQIGATPFLLITFGEVNIASIFINLILLWTIPIIMLLGLLAGVVSLIVPILSVPILYIAYPILLLFSEVVRVLSNLYIPLDLNSSFAPIAVIYYLVLVFILGKLKYKS